MSGYSSELIQILHFLLPGFLTAWIFYGLTAYRRPSEFERIAQALVFNGLIQACTMSVHSVLLFIGRWYAPWEWTENSQFIWWWINALLLGLLISWCANQDWLHDKLRRLRLTANTSYPSQWFSAFKRNDRYVILDMKGGRRLRGWPMEWPDSPDDGQFQICNASWILDDGTLVDLNAAECLLIPSAEVEIVEFLNCIVEEKAVESSASHAVVQEPTLINGERPNERQAITKPVSNSTSSPIA